MVRVPNFKLIAKGKDITKTIKKELIELSFEDKEGSESDEISFRVNGIYQKPFFGDSLELWLGYGDELFKCGKFSVQTTETDYTANTTEVRATAVNFASPIKVKKSRTWQDTTLFTIVKKIADENSLSVKIAGDDFNVSSKLQDNLSDLDFLYGLCFELNYLMAVKNGAIIVTSKDARSDELGSKVTPKNKALPKNEIRLSECHTLRISSANRNVYNATILEWQDSESGKTKSIKVGSGNNAYKMRIAAPKSDAEAFKIGESKLNELQRGGINGSLECDGKEVKAGGKLKLIGVANYEDVEFSIKSVTHTLNNTTYTISVEFEG
ncbi:phage tail protein, gpD family [Campylobacter blaseri]|uniref:Phage tail protein n=1 Tax=Campylobacter blaseri TaxID=2042961 RepID=A0A2P8QYP5_9BACT|nr:phage tail protein [Campylobacter blaseri]PSM51376.1 phage tail protein [Campylobacter blaseri]PSM52826.1 phage tail protein [Campylobacter blaseri]QKF86127.1 phage tail protein, gpD family [Campylobacter blaseri]